MLCGTDMRRVLPPLTGLAMLAALVLVFLLVPTEADMGIVQRIFYFHVSSAWVAFLGFFLVAGASAVYLWNGAPTADRLAYAGAEVGVVFCTRRGWSTCAYEARSSRTRWRRCVGRWMRAAGRWHELPTVSVRGLYGRLDRHLRLPPAAQPSHARARGGSAAAASSPRRMMSR